MQTFIASFIPAVLLFSVIGYAQPSPLNIPYAVAVAGADITDEMAAYFTQATEELNTTEVFGEFVAVDWETWSLADSLDGAILVTDLNDEIVLRYIYTPPVSAKSQSLLLEDTNLPTIAVENPHSMDVLMASALYGVGRCELATDYEVAVEDLPTFATPLRLAAGNCYLLRGDQQQAIEIFTPLAPNNPIAANNLAWLLLGENDPDAAFALLDQSVTDAAGTGNNTLHADALARRAAFHALAFDFDPAIADISAAIALRPGYAPYYKQRADHIFLIYEWDRVLADYNAAILIDPEYADAYYARGVLYYTQGPRPRALTDFQRFIQLAPNDARVPEAQEYITSIQAELDALGGDDTGAFGPSD